MSTVNSTTCSDCSSTEGSRRTATIFSSVTTSIAASSRSRQSACFSRTKSSSPRTSSSCAGTTSARRSTASTASTTSASAGTRSSSGRRSRTRSTVCRSARSSTRRFSAHTAGSRPTSARSSRFVALCARRTFRTLGCCAICSGRIPTRIFRAGARTTAESRSPLARMSSPSSCSSTTLISCAAPTRSSRRATSSLPSASLSLSSLRPTIAASSTMRAP
eukprot:Amastigsp_a842909_369.p2 type:complete len:219 gc:universal Amastigsp_a842909_369:917-261(-)